MSILDKLNNLEESNPELAKRVKDTGVGVVEIPKSLEFLSDDRAFYNPVINTMFVKKDNLVSDIEEELLHAAQVKEMGILNYLLRNFSEMIQHGAGTYDTPGTLEGAHYSDYEEKDRLLDLILGKENVYGKAAIKSKERDLTRSVKYWLEGDDEMSRFPDRNTLKQIINVTAFKDATNQDK